MQGTLEFMSHTARVAFDTPARYLQSPLDDLESFYWVALWAALRNKSVDMEKLTSDEIRWRKAICGNTQERLSLTVEIGANRDAEDLQKFNPVLRDTWPMFKTWWTKLQQRRSKWSTLQKVEVQATSKIVQFDFYAIVGVHDFLDILIEQRARMKDLRDGVVAKTRELDESGLLLAEDTDHLFD